MLDSNPLSMLDERGGRIRIIPAEVRGKFRRWRTRVYFVLLAIFLTLPWITINGTQAVMFDIPNRHFELFGLVFMAHDSPIIFFFLALFALGLITATALWGRVWCGWACPQTVFIDAVYRRIEIWIEGDYLERRKLSQAPLSSAKFFKILAKWLAYFVVSSLFAHSFIAYFSGSRRLMAMMSGAPHDNWNYFLIVSAVTALLMFNFGWFREQFCIIMCPYGRFQNILMDQNSVSVTYNVARGEPRRGAAPAGQTGDCVSCNACVRVCPTGIDIRKGLQIECIGCTACIDACDEMMGKVKKPAGLIAYSLPNPAQRPRILRPRILAYFSLIFVFATSLAFALGNRRPFSVEILRAKGAPYDLTPTGEVTNHFKVHIYNQTHRRLRVSFSLPESAVQAGIKITEAVPVHELRAGEAKESHVFFTFPSGAIASTGQTDLEIVANAAGSGEGVAVKVRLIGPLVNRIEVK